MQALLTSVRCLRLSRISSQTTITGKMSSRTALPHHIVTGAESLATSLRLTSRVMCFQRLHTTPLRPARSSNPRDDPEFMGLADMPPRVIHLNRKHNKWGLAFLAVIPITAFCLGTWQIYRLQWKTELLARVEDRLARPPLPLPPHVDPSAAAEFDYRRVYAVGRWRHDQEMLIGPRLLDKEDGYMVITPLERPGRKVRVRSDKEKPISAERWWWPWSSANVDLDTDGKAFADGSRQPGQQLEENVAIPEGNTVLVNRGWIAKKFKEQRTRPESLVQGDNVLVEGLLREPQKKNMFTPENRPERGEFIFADVEQMAELTGASPVWIEATSEPDMMEYLKNKENGVPVARSATIEIPNNHAQYVFTWYALGAATTVMFWMVARKPRGDIRSRIKPT